MRLGVYVILSKKCGAFDKRWIRKGVVAVGALESNSIRRSCFVLRSSGDVKIAFVQLGLEQIFVLFLRCLGFCRLRKERRFIDDFDIIDDFGSSSSRWRWRWRWRVSS